jgi:hypothetical protein
MLAVAVARSAVRAMPPQAARAVALAALVAKPDLTPQRISAAAVAADRAAAVVLQEALAAPVS